MLKLSNISNGEVTLLLTKLHLKIYELTIEPIGVMVELLLVFVVELAAGILVVAEVEPKPNKVPIVGVVNNFGIVKYGVRATPVGNVNEPFVGIE